MTALNLASSEGQKHVLRALLENVSDINIMSEIIRHNLILLWLVSLQLIDLTGAALMMRIMIS